jgi:hypothetical protein
MIGAFFPCKVAHLFVFEDRSGSPADYPFATRGEATWEKRNELFRKAAFSPPERVYGPQQPLTETTPASVWAGIFCFAAPRQAPILGKHPRRALSAKSVDASKAMANFTGWTFAAVNAIASEVSNIQLRLYQINGDDHEEQDDHPLLDLLEGVNENMTGIELKYVLLGLT